VNIYYKHYDSKDGERMVLYVHQSGVYFLHATFVG
jgi:hypothetical protein